MLKSLFRSAEAKKQAKKQALEAAVRAAEAAGDLRGLIAQRRALAELEPREPAAWLALARAWRTAGEPRDAIAAYAKALECGAPAADTHLQLGVLHAQLSEHTQAVRELEAAAVLAPGDADVLCMLGTVMSDQRRFDQAAVLFERALALKPDFAEAHFNLGLARFEAADIRGAAREFARSAALVRGAPWDAARRADLARDPEPLFAGKDMGVNPIKLRHDCEQLEYLLGLARLPPIYREVLDDYRALLAEVASLDAESLAPFDAARHPLVARTYKRPFHIADLPRPDGALINPQLAFADIERRYLDAEPNVLVLDELLTPAALEAVRRYCLESTFWNAIKPGYLGAYFFDGFCGELMLHLAWQLRERFPGIFQGLPLQTLWAYKHDCTLPGLGVHADAAAVNVNFWITDDSANLEREGGGLLVWPQDAPADWGFAKFNHDAATILQYLESAGGQPMRAPYRANRAVIFDSDLFHATDRPRFREGYLNRRINITLLYGLRSM